MDINVELGKKYGKYFSMARFPLIIAGVTYIAFYIYRYHLLIKKGYQFSKTKLCLFLSTGASALLIAGFYSVEEAAYFGNIYHAIQYYFIVYVSEGTLVKRRLSNDRSSNPTPKIFYFLIALIICIILAVLREKSEKLEIIGAIWLLTSLLHFWYDGFIWSVRRQDV